VRRLFAGRNYLLLLLLIIFAFNGMDSLAVGLVLQNIKSDLHLSDTQLGVLTGIAFSIFYSVMGIPIARWADRGNRVTIIALTTAIWSVMVAMCGLAQSFAQLLLIRIGVAVGEAGCVPPAHSLIADHFNRAERPRAVAIFMIGASLNTVLGYFAAGWLNEFYGWRRMFMLLGLPGVGLAMLAFFTLRDPRRMQSDRTNDPSAALSDQAPFSRVVRFLWNQPTFRHLLLAYAVASFFAFGILQWQPSFFVRSYGIGTGDLGTWFVVIYGLGGVVGTYAGGVWASRKAANNERLQLRTMALGYCLFGVVSVFIYFARNRYVAFGAMTLTAVGGSAIAGPLFATLQTVVPLRMRATSIAIIYMCANLIGLGLGPLATGALSDALRPLLAQDSLRYALLIMCPGYLWAAWHLLDASKTVTRDVHAVTSGVSIP